MTPLDLLQNFYQRSNVIVQAGAPAWVTILHDSFRPSHEVWGEFFSRCVNCALDTHIYQAWAWTRDPDWFYDHSCADGARVKELIATGISVIVGEWSLATGANNISTLCTLLMFLILSRFYR